VPEDDGKRGVVSSKRGYMHPVGEAMAEDRLLASLGAAAVTPAEAPATKECCCSRCSGALHARAEGAGQYVRRLRQTE